MSKDKEEPAFQGLGKAIRDFAMALQIAGFCKPIAIEFDEKQAVALRDELSAMIKYSTRNNLKHNECLYSGVLLVAPRNFVW